MIQYNGRVIPGRSKPRFILGQPVDRFLAYKVLGVVVPLVLGIAIAKLVAGEYYGPTAIQMGLVFIALPICPIFVIKPRLTLWTILIFGNFLFFINRFMPNLPLGMGLEALIVAAAFGTILKCSIEKKWAKANIPKLLVFALIVYSVYYGFQIVNPNSPGILNDFYGFRWWLLPVMVPWLTSYWLGNGRDIRRFFILWMALTTIVMIYGAWQQGVPGSGYRFNSGEEQWLIENPTHNIWGTIRIFGTLGSADAMGMYMVAGIIVALTMLVSGILPTWAKFAVIAFIPAALTVMLWTMTRSAYAALPVGLFAITFITRNRLLVTFTACMTVLYVVLSVTGAGRGNVYVARFFTTTETEKDDSYQVRQAIQDRVMSKVFESPIGFGPNTTGANGQKTLEAAGGDQADAELAGTATDNYYLRIGLEAGWLGVLAFIFLALCTIISSLYCYFKAKSRSARYMLVAIVAVLAAMLLGSWANNYFQYPPLTQIFFMSLGLIGPLKDIKEEELIPQKEPKVYF
jgi:hypothetical protein